MSGAVTGIYPVGGILPRRQRSCARSFRAPPARRSCLTAASYALALRICEELAPSRALAASWCYHRRRTTSGRCSPAGGRPAFQTLKTTFSYCFRPGRIVLLEFLTP